MSARPGLCGGHQATGVPTAINNYRCRAVSWVEMWLPHSIQFLRGPPTPAISQTTPQPKSQFPVNGPP